MSDLETYPEGLGRTASIRYKGKIAMISVTHKTPQGELKPLAAFCQRNWKKKFLFEHEDVGYTVQFYENAAKGAVHLYDRRESQGSHSVPRSRADIVLQIVPDA